MHFTLLPAVITNDVIITIPSSPSAADVDVVADAPVPIYLGYSFSLHPL